ADNPRHRRVGALAGRAARAIGHRDKAWGQRFERLDRFPQRLFHLLGLGRKEFEADLDVAARFREQRMVAVEPAERLAVHAALRCEAAALTPRHRVTVNSPPFKCSIRSMVRPAAANQPVITSSSKPSRTWASLARNSSRSW